MNGGISQAERRVREMNRMAQQYVQQSNNYMRSAGRQQVQPRFEQVRTQAPEVKRSASSDEVQKQAVGQPPFMIDNEKLMILLIMYLLIKEKADIRLIAALGYLLL